MNIIFPLGTTIDDGYTRDDTRNFLFGLAIGLPLLISSNTIVASK